MKYVFLDLSEVNIEIKFDSWLSFVNVIKINNLEEAAAIFKQIGVDPYGIDAMAIKNNKHQYFNRRSAM